MRDQSGSRANVDLASQLRTRIRAGRRRGALPVRLLDLLRPLATAEGWGIAWTRARRPGSLHQTSALTSEERYPDLFDRAATLAPDARRLLSFGCSTGEELSSLRRRFPQAEIIGAEINRRSRRIAQRRVAADANAHLIDPDAITGPFDLVFALAVLQREPWRVAQLDIRDLTPIYPFSRFEAAVGGLVDCLRPGGLLFVANAQYRVEDSAAMARLVAIAPFPVDSGPRFGPDGRRLAQLEAATAFRKRAD